MKRITFYKDESIRIRDVRVSSSTANSSGISKACEWLRSSESNSVKFDGNRYREAHGNAGVSTFLKHLTA